MTLPAILRWSIIVGLIVLLEIAVRYGMVSRHVVAAPSVWVERLIELMSQQRVLGQVMRTMSIIGIAIAASILGGFVLGLVIHALPRLRRVLEPFLAIYYALPFFIFYPVLVAIFGISPLPIILMGFLSGVVAMIIATINAIDAIPRIYGKLGRVHQMSAAQVAVSLKLPAAMPYLFTGFKLAIAYSFTGVIGSEFILSSSGLGFSISHAYHTFDTPSLYAYILLVVIVSAVIVLSIHGIESRLAARHASGSRGAATGRGGADDRRWRTVGDIVLFCVLMVLIWHLLSVRLGPLALSSPARTLGTFVDLVGSGAIWPHAWATLEAFLLAMAISIGLGLFIGVWFGFSKLSGETGEPILVALYSLPKVTLFPIVLLVLGVGMWSKVGFGVLHGFIPLALFTINGIRNVKSIHMKAAATMHLTGWQKFRSIVLPSILPSLVAGLRVCFALTLLGVVVGEMFASYRGLGLMIMTSITRGDVSIVLAIAMFLYSLAGAANMGFIYLQRRLVHQD